MPKIPAFTGLFSKVVWDELPDPKMVKRIICNIENRYFKFTWLHEIFNVLLVIVPYFAKYSTGVQLLRVRHFSIFFNTVKIPCRELVAVTHTTMRV